MTNAAGGDLDHRITRDILRVLYGADRGQLDSAFSHAVRPPRMTAGVIA